MASIARLDALLQRGNGMGNHQRHHHHHHHHHHASPSPPRSSSRTCSHRNGGSAIGPSAEMIPRREKSQVVNNDVIDIVGDISTGDAGAASMGRIVGGERKRKPPRATAVSGGVITNSRVRKRLGGETCTINSPCSSANVGTTPTTRHPIGKSSGSLSILAKTRGQEEGMQNRNVIPPGVVPTLPIARGGGSIVFPAVRVAAGVTPNGAYRGGSICDKSTRNWGIDSNLIDGRYGYYHDYNSPENRSRVVGNDPRIGCVEDHSSVRTCEDVRTRSLFVRGGTTAVFPAAAASAAAVLQYLPASAPSPPRGEHFGMCC